MAFGSEPTRASTGQSSQADSWGVAKPISAPWKSSEFHAYIIMSDGLCEAMMMSTTLRFGGCGNQQSDTISPIRSASLRLCWSSLTIVVYPCRASSASTPSLLLFYKSNIDPSIHPFIIDEPIRPTLLISSFKPLIPCHHGVEQLYLLISSVKPLIPCHHGV